MREVDVLSTLLFNLYMDKSVMNVKTNSNRNNIQSNKAVSFTCRLFDSCRMRNETYCRTRACVTIVLHNKNMYDKCIAEQERVWQMYCITKTRMTNAASQIGLTINALKTKCAIKRTTKGEKPEETEVN
jgi:hypothetical protein